MLIPGRSLSVTVEVLILVQQAPVDEEDDAGLECCMAEEVDLG